MIGKSDCQMHRFDFRFLVLPQRRHGLHAILACEQHKALELTYALELPTHEQDTRPDAPLSALLSRRAIKVAFPVAQENFRQTTQATELVLLNLHTTKSTLATSGLKIAQ